MVVSEKLSDIHHKEECRIIQQLDYQTTAWFERDKYPWPLAMRENLFCQVRCCTKNDGSYNEMMDFVFKMMGFA